MGTERALILEETFTVVWVEVTTRTSLMPWKFMHAVEWKSGASGGSLAVIVEA
jgi:hypothetical protein